MSFKDDIEKKLFKKKEPSSFEAYCDIIFLFAKEFGWTPQQVNEIPIPITNALVSKVSNYYKEQEKASKKKGR